MYSYRSNYLGLDQTKEDSSGRLVKKRSWSRAVFSNLQRKGLEKRFAIEKYITKPNRRKLANQLGLTDAQVKGKCIIVPSLVYNIVLRFLVSERFLNLRFFSHIN